MVGPNRYYVQIHNPATGHNRRLSRICLVRPYLNRLIVLAPDEIIASVREGSDLDRALARWTLKRPAGTKSIEAFYVALQTYLSVSADAAKALERVGRMVTDAALGNAICRVLDQFGEGEDAEKAFQEFRGVLPDCDIEALVAGRKAGNLSEVIRRLTAQSSYNSTVTRKMRRAMFYPLIVMFLASGIIALLLAKQVPAMQQNFKAFGVEPKGYVSTLFHYADATKDLPWLPAVLPVLVLYCFLNFETLGSKPFFQRIIYRVPTVRKLIYKVQMAKCLGTYGLLKGAGVEIGPCFEIASRQSIIPNIRAFFVNCRNAIGRGAPTFFAAAIPYAHLLGPEAYELTSLLQAGEESGKQGEIADRIALTYQRDAEDALDNIATVVEPLFLTLTAGVVMFVMAITILPTIQLNLSLLPSTPAPQVATP